MGLIEQLGADKVRSMNLREPVVVPRDATVRDAILAMREGDLGCAIVVDDAHKPVGMFTEGQLREELPFSPDMVNRPVARYMADRFPWVNEDDAVEVVLDAMRVNNTRFVCVVDADGKLVGLTGQKGLMEYIAETFPRQVMVQRVGGTPYPEDREGA
ncbi:MAG: CBS domain-containing protein [Planctomycetota bacterium]|nr:MAG: CBS domain-containing protein [Planctomycetota bacterium]REJ96611.1 MAG: CBS domain-containing protein [Planctomycetota bacterium]REK24729.1 MAG: CBS domain-containing protein [Planctomycetota bacterium]REK30000.1 MAG: CBS domain-containing protein [Planctomycetota bacterium]